MPIREDPGTFKQETLVKKAYEKTTVAKSTKKFHAINNFL